MIPEPKYFMEVARTDEIEIDSGIFCAVLHGVVRVDKKEIDSDTFYCKRNRTRLCSLIQKLL